MSDVFVVMAGERGQSSGHVKSVTLNSMEALGEARDAAKAGAFVWVERWNAFTNTMKAIYAEDLERVLVDIARGD